MNRASSSHRGRFASIVSGGPIERSASPGFSAPCMGSFSCGVFCKRRGRALDRSCKGRTALDLAWTVVKGDEDSRRDSVRTGRFNVRVMGTYGHRGSSEGCCRSVAEAVTQATWPVVTVKTLTFTTDYRCIIPRTMAEGPFASCRVPRARAFRDVAIG